MGLKLVAEGVENENQRKILDESECDTLQGFLFSKAMTEDKFYLFAEQHVDPSDAVT